MDKSIWLSTSNMQNYDSINQNIECDIAIIGGGLTGITCGYMLSKEKYNVAIFEKEKLMNKTSGHTTAKITSEHGLIYNYLSNSFDEEYAKKYFEANQQAIKNIKQIIDNENIDCDFKYQDSYVYTKSNKFVEDIKKEYDTINKFSQDVEYVNRIPLPISNVLGAIKFENQAEFNPIKYARGLCDKIQENKGKIFENSEVKDVKKEGDFYKVKVNNSEVKAKYVIYATRYSNKNFPGFYFMKTYQAISYCECFEFKEETFEGMYINEEEPTLSARIINVDHKPMLLVAGCTKRVGEEDNISNPYITLETFAHSIYPSAKLTSKWSTEDTISLDKIAYIGTFSKFMPKVYIATAFNKWGITTSNIAASIITNEICGRGNEYKEVFDSSRINLIKNRQEVKNMMVETADSLVIEKIKGSKNPRCTHLGCVLKWNKDDKTWDCPCHGSRFDEEGNVLYGPAMEKLK